MRNLLTVIGALALTGLIWWLRGAGGGAPGAPVITGGADQVESVRDADGPGYGTIEERFGGGTKALSAEGRERGARPRPTSPAAEPKRGAGAPPQPEGRIVEFTTIDGMAVAFGDIVLGKLEAGYKLPRGRTEAPAVQLWDSPRIAYVIHPDLPEKRWVEEAIRYMNTHTPVTFVPRTDERDAIVFEAGTEHCLSALGKQGGLQPIRLSPGCLRQEILHEILHSLGFVHEQSRTDRDRYIEVMWDNIEEKYKSQFLMVPELLMEAMRGSAFDYRSVMMYRPDTFGVRPGVTTIRALGDVPVEPVGDGLSEGDVQRLKRLFRL